MTQTADGQAPATRHLFFGSLSELLVDEALCISLSCMLLCGGELQPRHAYGLISKLLRCSHAVTVSAAVLLYKERERVFHWTWNASTPWASLETMRLRQVLGSGSCASRDARAGEAVPLSRLGVHAWPLATMFRTSGQRTSTKPGSPTLARRPTAGQHRAVWWIAKDVIATHDSDIYSPSPAALTELV